MKKQLLIFVFAIISTTILISGCQQTPGTTESKGDSPVLATIDGTKLTEEDVRFEIEMLPEEVRAMASTREGRDRLMENFVQKEMLYREAKARELQKKPEFEKRLKDLEKRVLIDMLLVNELEKSVIVTDQEAQDFYNENTERFIGPGAEGEEEKPLPFDNVKDIIKDYLTQEKQQLVFEQFMESIKSKYKVELNEEAIEKAFGPEVSEGGPGMMEIPPELIEGQMTLQEEAAPEPEEQKQNTPGEEKK